MRCGKEEAESSARGKDNRLKLLDDEYAIVHCTGYIKVRFIQDGTPGLEKKSLHKCNHYGIANLTVGQGTSPCR